MKTYMYFWHEDQTSSSCRLLEPALLLEAFVHPNTMTIILDDHLLASLLVANFLRMAIAPQDNAKVARRLGHPLLAVAISSASASG